MEGQPIPELNKERILDVFRNMLGTQMQTVPKYSAVKVAGKRLYKYARQGEDVELPKKEIIIHQLYLQSFDTTTISFDAHCSKGTYVRTLGEDIAQKLGTVGYLSQLERIASGQFKQEHSLQLFSELIDQKDHKALLPLIEKQMVDIQSILPFEQFEVDSEWLPKISNGQRLPLSLLPSMKIGQKILLMNKGSICAL